MCYGLLVIRRGDGEVCSEVYLAKHKRRNSIIVIEFQQGANQPELEVPWVSIAELKKACNNFFAEGRYTAVIAACDQFLAESRVANERQKALRFKAQAIVAGDGRWGNPALSCLKEALELVKKGSVEEAEVHAALSAAYAALASPHCCKVARDRFCEILKTTESEILRPLLPDVEYNLGVAYEDRDDMEAAEDAYITAYKLVIKADDPYVASLKPLVMLNLAGVFQEMASYSEANQLLNDAVKFGLPDEEWGAQLRHKRARYALHVGDLAAATLWVESGLAHPSCTVKARAGLLLVKAELAAAQARWADARDTALEALRMAAIAQSGRHAHRISRFLNRMQEGVEP